MENVAWEKVLIEWVNCLKLSTNVTRLGDLRNGQFFYKLMKLIKDPNIDHSKNLLGLILTFLSEHYPSCDPQCKHNDQICDISDNALKTVVSLLLHYTCIYDQRDVLTSPLCHLLSQSTQTIIRNFLQMFDNNVNCRDLYKTINDCLAKCSLSVPESLISCDYIDSPLEVILKTPMLKSRRFKEKDKEIVQLKGELEMERYEKLDLQEELKSQVDKNTKLENKLSKRDSEILRLRNEIVALENQSPPHLQDADLREAQKRLNKEIKSLEKYIHQLENEQEEIQNERDATKRKVSDLEEQCMSWKSKCLDVEKELATAAATTIRQKEELNDLQAQCTEMSNILEEMKSRNQNDSSFIFDSLQVRDRNFATISSSENLASSVVEVQLKNAQKQLQDSNQTLNTMKEEIDSLKCDNSGMLMKISELSENVKSLEQKLESLNSENLFLLHQKSRLTSELVILNENFLQQTSSINDLNLQMKNITQNLDDTKISLDCSKQLNDDLTEQIAILKQNVEKKDEAHLDLLNDCRSMKAKHIEDIKNKETFISKLERSILELNDENKGLKEEIYCLGELNKTLKSRLHECQQFLTVLSFDIEKFKGQCSDRLSYFNNKLKKLDLLCKTLQKKYLLIGGSIKVLKDDILSLKKFSEKEKTLSTTMLAELETNVDKLCQKIKIYEKDVERLHDSLLVEQNSTKNLSNEIEIVNVDLKKITDENLTLIDQHESLKTGYNKLEIEHQNLKEDYTKLINALSKKNDELNVVINRLEKRKAGFEQDLKKLDLTVSANSYNNCETEESFIGDISGTVKELDDISLCLMKINTYLDFSYKKETFYLTEIENLKEEITQCLSTYFEKLEESKESKIECEYQINSLTENLHSVVEKYNNLEKEQEQSVEKIKSYQNHIENLKKQYTESTKSFENYILEKDNKIATMKNDLEKLYLESTQTIQDLEKEKNNLNKNIVGYKVEIENSKTITQNLEQKLEELKNFSDEFVLTNNALLSKIKDFEKEQKKLLENLEFHVAEIKDLQGMKENLEKQLKESNKLSNEIVLKNNSILLQIESLEKEKNKLVENIDKYLAEVQNLQRSKENLEKILEESKIFSDTLVFENNSLLSKIEDLEKEQNKFIENIDAYVAEVKDLRTLKQNLENQVADVISISEKEISEKENKVKSLKTNFEKERLASTANSEGLENKILELQKLREDCLKQIDELKIQFDEMSSKNCLLSTRIGELEMQNSQQNDENEKMVKILEQDKESLNKLLAEANCKHDATILLKDQDFAEVKTHLDKYKIEVMQLEEIKNSIETQLVVTNTKYEDILAAKNNEIFGLTESLVSKNEGYDKMILKIEESQQEVHKLQKEKVNLELKLQEAEELIQKQSIENKSIGNACEAKLEEQYLKTCHYEEEVLKHNFTILTLENQINELQTKLELYKNQKERVEEVLNSTKNEHFKDLQSITSHYEEILAGKKYEVDKMSETLLSKNQECEHLVLKVEEIHQEIEKLENEKVNLESKLQEAEELLQKQTIKNKSVERKCEAMLAEQDLKIRDYEEKVLKHNLTVLTLENQIDELQRKLELYKNQKENIEGVLISTKNENVKDIQRIESHYEVILNEHKGTFENLNLLNEKLTKELNNTKNEILYAQDKIKELVNENHEFEQKFKEAEFEVSKKISEIDTLKNSLQDQDDTIAESRSVIQENLDVINDLRTRNEKLKIDIDILTRELEKARKNKDDILESQKKMIMKTEENVLRAHENALEVKSDLLNRVEISEKEKAKMKDEMKTLVIQHDESKFDLNNKIKDQEKLLFEKDNQIHLLNSEIKKLEILFNEERSQLEFEYTDGFQKILNLIGENEDTSKCKNELFNLTFKKLREWSDEKTNSFKELEKLRNIKTLTDDMVQKINLEKGKLMEKCCQLENTVHELSKCLNDLKAANDEHVKHFSMLQEDHKLLQQKYDSSLNSNANCDYLREKQLELQQKIEVLTQSSDAIVGSYKSFKEMFHDFKAKLDKMLFQKNIMDSLLNTTKMLLLNIQRKTSLGNVSKLVLDKRESFEIIIEDIFKSSNRFSKHVHEVVFELLQNYEKACDNILFNCDVKLDGIFKQNNLDEFIDQISDLIDRITDNLDQLKLFGKDIENLNSKTEESKENILGRSARVNLNVEKMKEDELKKKMQMLKQKLILSENSKSNLEKKVKQLREENKKLSDKPLDFDNDVHYKTLLSEYISYKEEQGRILEGYKTQYEKLLKEYEKTTVRTSTPIEDNHSSPGTDLLNLKESYKKLVEDNCKLENEAYNLKKIVDEHAREFENNSSIKEAYERLLEENNKLMTDIDTIKYKRSRDRDEFIRLLRKEKETASTRIQNIKVEYESKLEKMKGKMIQLYKEEINKEMGKMKSGLSEEPSLIKLVQTLKSDLFEAGQKIHLMEMERGMKSNDMFGSRESLPGSFRLHDFDNRGLRERQSMCNYGNPTETGNSLGHDRAAMDPNRMSAFHRGSMRMMDKTVGQKLIDDRRASTLPRTAIASEDGKVETRCASDFPDSNMEMEDEDEKFDNKYLSDLKEGKCQLDKTGRVSELAWRNSLVPPHLKSSYPAETQFFTPNRFKEDDLKAGSLAFDDSLSKLLPSEKPRKKDFGTTSYKKPGPPTPSKNGGRFSLQGNEVHPAKDTAESKTPKKSTPSRIKAMFTAKNSSKTVTDGNSPKNRRLNIFKRPK